MQNPVLPELWRAKVAMIPGDKSLFHGFERVGSENDPDYPGEEQEWAV